MIYTMNNNQFNLSAEEQTAVRNAIRQTLIIALAMLATVVIYAAIAYFVKPQWSINLSLLKTLYFIFNALAVLFILLILSIRRFIYFSPKIIGGTFDLKHILARWRSIDILFLAFAESIALLGLVITLMGISFDRSFHFFVTSGLLILILMPLEMKFSNRITALKNHQKGPMC